VNSTRVLRELEEDWKETTGLEAKAREPEEKAVFLRRLGRMGDKRSNRLYERRLNDRQAAVRAAAMDALLLNAPDRAERWLDRKLPYLVRARREGKYDRAIPILETLAAIEYDNLLRKRGEKELAEIRSLSDSVLKLAESLFASGDVREAFETYEQIVASFEGLPAADKAAQRIEMIRMDPELRDRLGD
jgi:hypothetical protein